MTPCEPEQAPKVTNDPDELNELWGRICTMLCKECAKSECGVKTHMPYMCRCGHNRRQHETKHPHQCSPKHQCDCEAVYFVTDEEARENVRNQILLVMVILDELPAFDLPSEVPKKLYVDHFNQSWR